MQSKHLYPRKMKSFLVGALALALLNEPASAGYIQTLGLGQKSSSLAGAITATSSDFDAFYTNPAGAANFDSQVIGSAIKLIDTTNLEVNDGAGGGVKDTFKGEAFAVAPALGAYLPVMPGAVVMGLGIGAPFLFGADYNDQAWGNTVTNDNSTNFELVYIEATPTIAMKVNDKLNIGLGINIGLAKHFKETIKFSNFSNIPLLPHTVDGTLSLQSDDDMPLPMAPWEFSTGPTAITFTVGAQYQLLPNFKIGAVYRGETPNEFESDLRFIWDLTNAFAPCNVLGGPLDDCGGGEQFKTTIELPRHLQLGFAWQAMENWELSFDVQWTNWSKATGFGSPLIMDLTRSQNAPNLAFTNGGAGLQGFFVLSVFAASIRYSSITMPRTR